MFLSTNGSDNPARVDGQPLPQAAHRGLGVHRFVLSCLRNIKTDDGTALQTKQEHKIHEGTLKLIPKIVNTVGFDRRRRGKKLPTRDSVKVFTSRITANERPSVWNMVSETTEVNQSRCVNLLETP